MRGLGTEHSVAISLLTAQLREQWVGSVHSVAGLDEEKVYGQVQQSGQHEISSCCPERCKI